MGSGPLGTLLLQALRGSKLLFMVSMSLAEATTATGTGGGVPPLIVDAERRSSIHKQHTRPVTKALVDLPPHILPLLLNPLPLEQQVADRSRKSKVRERGVGCCYLVEGIVVCVFLFTYPQEMGGIFGAVSYNLKVNAKKEYDKKNPMLGNKKWPHELLYMLGFVLELNTTRAQLNQACSDPPFLPNRLKLAVSEGLRGLKLRERERERQCVEADGPSKLQRGTNGPLKQNKNKEKKGYIAIGKHQIQFTTEEDVYWMGTKSDEMTKTSNASRFGFSHTEA